MGQTCRDDVDSSGSSQINSVLAALPKNHMLCLLPAQMVIMNIARLGLSSNLKTNMN